MALKSTVDRYHVYKAGTKRVIDWFVSSASRVANIKSVIQSLNCGLSVKGKKKDTNRASTSYSVRVQELLQLAQAISDAEPPVEVPASAIQVLKQVIAGRKESADWYAVQSLEEGGAVEKENEGQRYFIMVRLRSHGNTDKHGPRLVSFGSALSSCIVDEGLANAKTDAKEFLNARATMLEHYFKMHARGKYTEEALRKSIRSTLGFELVPHEPEPFQEHETPWAYEIQPSSEMYKPLFQTIVVLEGPYASQTLWGCPIAVPVDMLNYIRPK